MKIIRNKNNCEEAIKLLTKELAANKELQKIAAEMLEFCWSQGYAEVTEHKEVIKTIGHLACSWCGRLHYNPIHEKLSKIPEDTWNALPDGKFIHPINRALEAGLITQEDYDNL